MKCCNDLIGRLIRIEKRVNSLIVVRQILIEKPLPLPVKNTAVREPQVAQIVKPPIIITEERYVIDQNITSGYSDAYVRYDKFGNKQIDPYVFWLKTEDGFRRKLVPVEVPYQKGTPLALAWIERVKSVFDENKIEFDPAILKYRSQVVRYSFTIPRTANRWIVSGTKITDLNGNDLARFLPIIYNKMDGDILLERVIKYRVEPKIPLVVGYEPVFMTYQVLNKRTNIRTIYEGGVNNWIKFA
jgi:hypothetical protein